MPQQARQRLAAGGFRHRYHFQFQALQARLVFAGFELASVSPGFLAGPDDRVLQDLEGELGKDRLAVGPEVVPGDADAKSGPGHVFSSPGGNVPRYARAGRLSIDYLFCAFPFSGFFNASSVAMPCFNALCSNIESIPMANKRKPLSQ
jgi:hypothetical protein